MIDTDEVKRFLAHDTQPRVHLPDPSRIRQRLVKAREPLLRKGEPSDRAFIVYAGLLEAYHPESMRPLGWIPRGAWAGEIGVLTGDPRNATIRPWRDSLVLELDAASVRHWLTGHADAWPTLTRSLLARGAATTQSRPSPFLFGFLPVGGLDAGAFEQQLRAAAGRIPDTAVLHDATWHDDAASVLALEDGASQAGLWLLLADAAETAWTRMVVRAADVLVVVGPAEALHELTPLEQALGLPQAARVLDQLAIVEEHGVWSSLEANPRGLREVHTMHALTPHGLEVFLRRLMHESADSAHLDHFRIFQGLDEAALGTVREQIEWLSVGSGETVMEQGSAPDGLYLIDAGRFAVSRKREDGTVEQLGEFGAGDALGELALLGQSRRVASASATRESRVGFIDREKFDRLNEAFPAIGRNTSRYLARRWAEASTRNPTRRPSNLAVVLLDETPRCRRFAEQLLEAIESTLKFGVARIDEAEVERHLGPGSAALEPGQPGYPELVEWFYRIESDHDVVLYLCPAQQTPWSQRALRQADRVVCVAESESDPGLRPLEATFAWSAGVHHLVLLQRAGIAEASGTQAWLGPRGLLSHHHVRDETPGDVGRAVRHILDSAIGVAFASAASRGTAHFGLVRAMRELGMPIDIVAGSSSGATVAAGVAIGMSAEEGLAMHPTILRSLRIRPWQLQPPLTSLTNGSRLDQFLQEQVGDRRAEDQLIPCVLTAIDLNRHEPVYLSRGPLWMNLRASMSLPFLVPPVLKGNRTLVDGGLMTYLPAGAILPACRHGLSVLSNLGIGSMDDVDPEDEDERATTQVSGWKQLRNLLLPFGKQVEAPPLNAILFHSMCITSFRRFEARKHLEEDPHVCHVFSPIPNPGLFDVDEQMAKQMEQFVYERAREALARNSGAL